MTMRIEFTDLPFYPEFVELAGPERRLQMVRDYCNAQVRATAWTMLEHAPTDKFAWGKYRLAMQNFPDTYDPTDVNPIFPIEPQNVVVSNVVVTDESNISTQEE